VSDARADPPTARFTAVILAGERPGGDPLARAHGVAHKCLVPAAGTPMIERVLDAVAASPWIGTLIVSIDDPAALGDLAPVRALEAAGRLSIVPSEATPSRSVAAAVHAHPEPFPVMVTTADHPLLTSRIVDWFCAGAAACDADVVAGLTPARLLLEAFPAARRTFLRFGGEGYTGSNLFALITADGMAAVAFWQRVEAMRKRPWHLIRAFGAGPLLRYALRRVSLEEAFRIASLRIGARAAPLLSPFAEAGIDVDKPADLELARRLLEAR